MSPLMLARAAEQGADAGNGGLAPTGEDGAIVGGPRTPQQIAAQKRLQQTQAQVDEVRPLSIQSNKIF